MRYEYTQELTITLEGMDEIQEMLVLINEIKTDYSKPGFKAKLTDTRRELVEKLYNIIDENLREDNCAGD